MDAPGSGWASQSAHKGRNTGRNGFCIPPLAAHSPQRDPELRAIEIQIRLAIRDALNRNSRKPFYWGGLVGYQQLAAIAPALHTLVAHYPQHICFQQLSKQVDRTLAKNRTLADNLNEAHHWLRKVANCLRYPPKAYPDVPVTSQQVAQELQHLLELFQPDRKHQRPQSALLGRLKYLWRMYDEQLLPCYDIPGLPPDTLQLEVLFGRLRRHQRRISGRRSTRELNKFGHFQILFMADSQAEILAQMRKVSLEAYQAQRIRLDQSETRSRFLCRLHRDPATTMQSLADRYIAQEKKMSENCFPMNPNNP